MRTIGVTIRQTIILLVLGVAVGLGVNAARGKNHIDLRRNYTPEIPQVSVNVEPNEPAPPQREEPYNTITVEEIAEIVEDPSRAGLDLIIDARKDDLFQSGHVPNAVQCDPYNLEVHINEVASMAQGAERVIVYCHGGNCEDSYLLCQELVNRAVPKEVLYVFKAGWDGWQAYMKQPTEPQAAPATEKAAPSEAAPSEPDGQKATGTTLPFKAIDLKQTLDLFEDPKASDGTYVFVDARADDPYQAGHIPGAIQCDYYRIDYYFPEVMQKASAAEKIVVYCNGGDCEDSLYVCGELLKADIPRAHILLFKGGWEEWTKAGHPVETGKE